MKYAIKRTIRKIITDFSKNEVHNEKNYIENYKKCIFKVKYMIVEIVNKFITNYFRNEIYERRIIFKNIAYNFTLKITCYNF